MSTTQVLEEDLNNTHPNDSDWMESIRLSRLGNDYAATKDYKKAIDYFLQSLAIANQINDDSLKAKILSSLGLAYAILEAMNELLNTIKSHNLLPKKLEIILGFPSI
jgi:tetratricopeptide (TPR) repeat protein